MVKKEETFLKRLLEIFTVEADEHLKSISTSLLELEKTSAGQNREKNIESIFREVHSLKGAARSVNRADIENICHPMESLLAALKNDEIALSKEIMDLLHQAVNEIEGLLSLVEDRDIKDRQTRLKLLVQRLEGALTGYEQPASDSVSQGVIPASEHRTHVAETVRIPVHKLDTLFRQVEEMITVKLSADQRIAELRELANMIEKRNKTTQGLRTHLHANLRESNKHHQPHDSPGIADLTKWIDDLEKVDSNSRLLTKNITEIITAAQSDRRVLGKMVDNLLEDTKKMLMMPISRMFEILPKIARDLASAQGKLVEVEIQESDIEIDRRIQQEMKDPLIHLMRNCVDHGIEKTEVRNRKNKPERGKITISIMQRDSGRVELVISDDGAGIDQARVLAVAKESGIVSTEEAARMEAQDITALVFRSGISTSPILTDISGRGLGLAIVREKLENLNGTIALETKADTGARFHITLPVMLSAFRGVLVRTEERLFALPSLNVERVTRVRTEDIKTVENRETLNLNGDTLSLLRLADVLGLQRKVQSKQSGDLQHVVVLGFSDERIAFMVDGILGEQEILQKGLGSQLARVRNIAGSTTTGAGDLVPILNVSDLLKYGAGDVSSRVGGMQEQLHADVREKSILVVEDSITARALLKNILQAAGYHVKTAVDGVDAFTILKTEPFDLVVSDVEMPRMDGFNLTVKIRNDKKLTELPVILVTALDSREHRERGIEAGANAYIVKSGFDETGLLKVIDRLI